jgi:hypothetical protein
LATSIRCGAVSGGVLCGLLVEPELRRHDDHGNADPAFLQSAHGLSRLRIGQVDDHEIWWERLETRQRERDRRTHVHGRRV